jgi:uncharacterized protein with HEPN domain
MSRHDVAASLQDMRDYAEKAVRFCEAKSRDAFEQDELLQLAIVRLIELIGEAASRIVPDVRNRFPMIPWQEIVATRNRLIHGYDRIDLAIVWDTVQDDLPPLIEALRQDSSGD